MDPENSVLDAAMIIKPRIFYHFQQDEQGGRQIRVFKTTKRRSTYGLLPDFLNAPNTLFFHKKKEFVTNLET